MKKLGRMNINSGNLLKDEELKTLRGGQLVQCAVYYDGENGEYQGLHDFLCYDSQSDCDTKCEMAYADQNAFCFCNYGY